MPQHHLTWCCLAGQPCGWGMGVEARDSAKVKRCLNPAHLEPPDVGMDPSPLPYRLLWNVCGFPEQLFVNPWLAPF